MEKSGVAAVVAVGATVGVGGLSNTVAVGTGGAVRRTMVGPKADATSLGGWTRKLPRNQLKISNPTRVTALPNPTAIQGTPVILLAELFEEESECLAINSIIYWSGSETESWILVERLDQEHSQIIERGSLPTPIIYTLDNRRQLRAVGFILGRLQCRL